MALRVDHRSRPTLNLGESGQTGIDIREDHTRPLNELLGPLSCCVVVGHALTLRKARDSLPGSVTFWSYRPAMADVSCVQLRQALVEVKAARNLAMVDMAKAFDEGRQPAYTDADVEELRLRVDQAARAARRAGCDISDLVGPGVGAD